MDYTLFVMMVLSGFMSDAKIAGKEYQTFRKKGLDNCFNYCIMNERSDRRVAGTHTLFYRRIFR